MGMSNFQKALDMRKEKHPLHGRPCIRQILGDRVLRTYGETVSVMKRFASDLPSPMMRFADSDEGSIIASKTQAGTSFARSVVVDKFAIQCAGHSFYLQNGRQVHEPERAITLVP